MSLSFFRFADEQSVRNAKLAEVPKLGDAFLIIGPRATGKTLLAKECLSPIYGDLLTSDWPNKNPGKRTLALMSAIERGYLFLDDVSMKEVLSQELLNFLTSRTFTARWPGTQTAVSTANNSIKFITINAASDTEIPPMLETRTKVIRLAGIPEGGAK